MVNRKSKTKLKGGMEGNDGKYWNYLAVESELKQRGTLQKFYRMMDLMITKRSSAHPRNEMMSPGPSPRHRRVKEAAFPRNEVMSPDPSPRHRLNIFDLPTMKRDNQIITDKRNGADIDDMKVLYSMLNILNILEEKTYLASDENIKKMNTFFSIDEYEKTMIKELKEEIIAIITQASTFISPPEVPQGAPPEVPFEVPPEEVLPTWTCPYCTFNNVVGVTNCEMCGRTVEEPVFKEESSSRFHYHNGELCETVD